MVYDTISDNVVQLGLTIANAGVLNYDIILKKHIQRIRSISIQFDGIPLPAQAVTLYDATNTPNVTLYEFVVANTETHTAAPPGDGSVLIPEYCGRIINVKTSPALTASRVLYLLIMFDRAGDR